MKNLSPAALLVFVLVNHFLVGVVIQLARGQNFAESGVFGFFTLALDFTVLSMGGRHGADLVLQPICIRSEYLTPLPD